MSRLRFAGRVIGLPDLHFGRNLSKGLALPFAFALLLIFIQEGYSYYASVQTVALLFLAGLVAWA